ncbi:protein tramtrack, beta isoform-like isoform X5 [Penaeus japonicus]|uniref:protein tramtrack, beta isoform-like isoform X5 n=1 Tax=Penaeus japonicus TaxID=27405 RepID=UPI001C70D8A0|nr:protein tramtrack, beta isoform-like isoform X5 [Penaeus japonicus]
MGDGMLSLSWNNHHATFCDILTKLREKESYTDVTLSCEGKFYPLHKLVLSTCSEYFERIFEKTPCKHPVIVLNDIKCRELEALLSYMYAGEVSVPQSNLAMLIKVAEVLQIKGLAVPDTPPTPAKSKSSSLESGVDRGSPHPPKRRRTEERLVDTTRTMHEPTSPNVRVNPTDKGRQVTHEELHTRKDQEGSDDPLAISDLGQEDYYAAEIKEEIIEDVVDSEGNQAGRTDHNLDYDAQLAPFKSEGNSRDSIPGHTSSAEYSDPQYEHLNPSSMQTSEMNPGPSEIIEWQDGIVESDVVSGEGCSGVGLLQPSSPMLSQQTPQLLAQQGMISGNNPVYKSRGTYIRWTPEERLEIARACSQMGLAKASREMSKKLNRKLSKSTAQNIHKQYLKMMKEQLQISDSPSVLPAAKQGQPAAPRNHLQTESYD